MVALWEAAMERRYHLLISPAIVAEVAEKLRSKFGWGEARILQRSKLMAKTGKKIIVPRLVIEVMRDDPDDNRILECAVEGKADLIVSGDRALLRLKSYDGIPIVRPVDFLRILGLA